LITLSSPFNISMSHTNHANIRALFDTITHKPLQLHIIRNSTIFNLFSPRTKHPENHTIIANVRNHSRIYDTI